MGFWTNSITSWETWDFCLLLSLNKSFLFFSCLLLSLGPNTRNKTTVGWKINQHVKRLMSNTNFWLFFAFLCCAFLHEPKWICWFWSCHDTLNVNYFNYCCTVMCKYLVQVQATLFVPEGTFGLQWESLPLFMLSCSTGQDMAKWQQCLRLSR